MFAAQEHEKSVLLQTVRALIDTNKTFNSEAYKKGMYPYIPIPPEVFFNALQFVADYTKLDFKNRLQWLNSYFIEKTSFLDVGCGIGITCFLARKLGFHDYGIEFDDNLSKKAIENGFCCNVHKGDALLYDKYDQFDVIYYYRPMCDHTKQKQLEEKIERDCKKGAIIMGFYRVSPVPTKGFKIIRGAKDNEFTYGNVIYQKV